MRKKNSVAEFSSQRSELLLRNFRESIARQSRISVKRAICDAIEAPAPRFWVTDVRATLIIKAMMEGRDILDGMLPEKQRMYREIYRRVWKLRLEEPDTPLGDLVMRVVYDPAPESYLSYQRAKSLLLTVRKMTVRKNGKRG